MERVQEYAEPATLEGRFEIGRELGQGGNGVVFLVRDRSTGEQLALKKLLRMDAKNVLRLKREFRSLADLHHRNLVKLYEMERAGDTWFITMEYLQGEDILSYVGLRHDTVTTVSRRRPANLNEEMRDEHLSSLCDAFAQLAHGVDRLHRAGMLHRDLKPSNVMVTDGRVVVLDFGLVRELGESAVTVTVEDTIAGTPAYMAPEQVQNTVLSEATDWYAFGAMLYEAVSGALPYEGRLLDVLRAKLDRDATPLDQRVPEVPRELGKLCMALLQRDALRRPSYEQIIHTLRQLAPDLEVSTQGVTNEQVRPVRTIAAPALVGRKFERTQLEHAFAELAHGRLVALYVRGPSGAGKSAMVEAFLEGLEGRASNAGTRDALVLRARCFEREAMPFKALDGLLDALVNHLACLDDVVVSHMLPIDLPELAHAFPVLERLPAVSRLLKRAQPRSDAARERTRAQGALRDLLRRLAMQRALALWIDDLQWADLDSVAILKSWLEASEPIPLLLVLTYRSDESETNACLRMLAQHDGPRHALEFSVDLSPLMEVDIRALCLRELGDHAAEHQSVIERVVTEAQGSPFLAHQLLILAKTRIAQGDSDASNLSVTGLVSQMTALLSDSERQLLAVLAIAGRPLLLRSALAAAAIHDGRSRLHALQSLSLTRMRVVNGRRMLELYHDRIREAVIVLLTAAQSIAIHQRLLAVLEQSGEAEPGWLHSLAVGAQDQVLAVRYGLIAADRAATSLAFERASALYRDCLGRSPDAAANGALWRKLGDALASGGHGTRAAAAYLEAAQRAPASEAVELRRAASTHLIRSGHFAEGDALVRTVLAEMKLDVPRTQAGLFAAIGWERARLWARGLEPAAARSADETDDRTRLCRLYGTLSIDAQAYDPLRAALFDVRALRLALDIGDPELLATTLCFAAVSRAVSGEESDERYAEDLLQRAHAIAEQLDSQLLRARVRSARTMLVFLSWRTRKVVECSDEAEQLYRAHFQKYAEPAGEYYHRFAVNVARIGALFQLGQLKQGRSELSRALGDARATENRTAAIYLTFVRTCDEIFSGGDAEVSRARLEAEHLQLPPQGYGPLHMLHMVAVMRLACALEDFAWAEPMVAKMWPQFERSIVRRSTFSLLAYSWHSRMLLNRHVVDGCKGDPRALVRADLRAVGKLSASLGTWVSTRALARLAYLTGQRDQAISLYRANIAACEEREYCDELERARWALGTIIGDDDGLQMCEHAIVRLRDLGIVDPMGDLREAVPELVAHRLRS